MYFLISVITPFVPVMMIMKKTKEGFERDKIIKDWKKISSQSPSELQYNIRRFESHVKDTENIYNKLRKAFIINKN